jgi:hypothetical protein
MPEGKRRIGRPRHRWKDNIKKDIREMGWGVMEWIQLAQWMALVNTVINLQVL